MKMKDMEFIRNLAKLINEESLDVIEIKEEGKYSIRMEKHAVQQVMAMPSVAAMPKETHQTDKEQTEVAAKEGVIIYSPMVGVFYEAPSPGAKPYVSVGSRVKEGDILCILEAMKLMNELVSEQNGTIAEIFVKNEEVVEYNQPLFRIVTEDE